MIEANKILQADILDLIFDGRNKAYGAYELRVNYRRRLAIAVLSMILLCGCVLLLYAFTSKPGKKAEMYTIVDPHLEDFKEKEKVVQPPSVEPPKPQQQIKMSQYTPPIITHDEVKPDEMPPQMDELQDTKIGTIDVDGDKDQGIVAPPVSDEGKGIIDQPKKDESDVDKIFVGVQIESEYPGGISAWIRYLTKTLPKYYGDDLVEQGIQGRVIVQFVVDTEGNVSDVRGIEGPKELWGIAEKVIRQSGKWTAAIQNGHKVKSYKRQPIIFKVDEQ